MYAPVTLPIPLSAYRDEILAEGAPGALPFVPSSAVGLLNELPVPPLGAPDAWPWTTQSPPVLSSQSVDWPEMHIVMPSFLQGQFIEAAIRSVLLQNYPRLRFVVLDAGSNDNTTKVIGRYRPWLSHVRIGPDRGQSHAINLGLALGSAQGLVGWLNSDDLYLPGTLQAVADAQRRYQADFIYGDGLSLDENTGAYSLDFAGLAHSAFRRYPGAIFSHAAFWAAKFQIPLWEKLRCALDYELWIRLLPLTRRRLHLPRPLGVIRVHPAAKSHSPTFAMNWEDDARLNAFAHPHIYGPDRLLALFHRSISRVVRAIRHTRSQTEATMVCAQARWPLSTPKTFV